uniref:RxLR effector protein n=1 Tax=Caenorhabditis tropicalis TaxID=1561998 RepID=A0A1I7U7H4_9PELO
MSKSLILLFAVLLPVAFALDSKPSRIFKERVRTQETTSTAYANDSHEEHHLEDDHHEQQIIPKRRDNVMGSMDTMESLARVQRDQAETFRLWASQFQTFKNNVMKFMEQSSDVLQKHEKKITTLQRLARKIVKENDN